MSVAWTVALAIINLCIRCCTMCRNKNDSDSEDGANDNTHHNRRTRSNSAPPIVINIANHYGTDCDDKKKDRDKRGQHPAMKLN